MYNNSFIHIWWASLEAGWGLEFFFFFQAASLLSFSLHPFQPDLPNHPEESWEVREGRWRIGPPMTRCCSVYFWCSSFSLVLFDIFVNILAHNLAEPAYEADVAQLEYRIVAGEHGLVIRLKGFNHKLPVRRRTVHTTYFYQTLMETVGDQLENTGAFSKWAARYFPQWKWILHFHSSGAHRHPSKESYLKWISQHWLLN